MIMATVDIPTNYQTIKTRLENIIIKVLGENTDSSLSSSSNNPVRNNVIKSALDNKGALTDDVDWTYNSNGFTNGVKLVSKTDNANGRITLHLKS